MSPWSVYELQGNLCFHTWSTSPSSFFTDLAFCISCFSHIFDSPLTAAVHHFHPFLKCSHRDAINVTDWLSFGQWWVCLGTSWNWLCLTWEQLLLFSHRSHSHSTLPATKSLPCELNIGQCVRRKSYNTGGAWQTKILGQQELHEV